MTAHFTVESSSAAPPRARRGPRVAPSIDDAVRGAPDDALSRPAAEFLGALPWEGRSPDPDALDAATFLAWL